MLNKIDLYVKGYWRRSSYQVSSEIIQKLGEASAWPSSLAPVTTIPDDRFELHWSWSMTSRYSYG